MKSTSLLLAFLATSFVLNVAWATVVTPPPPPINPQCQQRKQNWCHSAFDACNVYCESCFTNDKAYCDSSFESCKTGCETTQSNCKGNCTCDSYCLSNCYRQCGVNEPAKRTTPTSNPCVDRCCSEKVDRCKANCDDPKVACQSACDVSKRSCQANVDKNHNNCRGNCSSAQDYCISCIERDCTGPYIRLLSSSEILIQLTTVTQIRIQKFSGSQGIIELHLTEISGNYENNFKIRLVSINKVENGLPGAPITCGDWNPFVASDTSCSASNGPLTLRSNVISNQVLTQLDGIFDSNFGKIGFVVQFTAFKKVLGTSNNSAFEPCPSVQDIIDKFGLGVLSSNFLKRVPLRENKSSQQTQYTVFFYLDFCEFRDVALTA